MLSLYIHAMEFEEDSYLPAHSRRMFPLNPKLKPQISYIRKDSLHAIINLIMIATLLTRVFGRGKIRINFG